MVEQMRADKEAVLISLQLEIPAIDDKVRPLRDARFHQPQDVRLRRRRDDGAVIHIIAGGIGADLQFLDPRDQLLDQPVCGFIAHRHRDRDCHAAFARRAIACTDQRIRRLIHVGIRHDDHVVLRAAKALHALAVGTATAIDIFRNRRRPDKADAGNDRVIKDRVDRFLVAVDHLQHAIRQPCLLHQFRQHQGNRRIPLGRFQDEGIPAGQRGAHLPHRDHGRKVEGRDARRHTDGLAHGIHVDPRTCAVGEFPLQHVGRADAELDHFQPALDIALGIRDRLAMFRRQRLGQLVHVAVQQADEFHHHPRAALRVRRAPFHLRLCGIRRGGIQLCLGCQRDPRLHLARGGVEDVGKAA